MKASTEAEIEDDGAIKWKSNGSYLMDDFCEKLEYMDFPFSREATAKKRDAQVSELLSTYHTDTSEEAMVEMRSAFGAGTTVVDVLSGERIQL